MFQRHAALYDSFSVGDTYTRLRTVVPTSDVLNRLTRNLEGIGSAVFISRHGVDIALEQTVPQGLTVFLGLERGIGVVLHAIGLLVVIGGKGDIIVERLAIDW